MTMTMAMAMAMATMTSQATSRVKSALLHSGKHGPSKPKKTGSVIDVISCVDVSVPANANYPTHVQESPPSSALSVAVNVLRLANMSRYV